MENPASERDRANILIVDDQPQNLLALEAILEGLGQNLVKAGSGREALRHLLEKDFAVILLDVQMPEMDGFETATMVRQRERSRNSPIIFLTAQYRDVEHTAQAYATGAVDYVFKPVSPDILRAKVSVFVELHKKTEQLRQLNEELEARVVERTAALTAEIAERKREEEEKARLAAILDATPDLVAMANPQVNVFYLNNGGRKMLGVDHDEDILGTHVGQYHSEWARKLVLEEGIPTAIRDGNWSGETALLTRTGREIPVSQIILAHKAPDGTVQFLSTIARDITERKQAEDALRRSEARLKEAQHMAQLGYWLWDVDTDTDSWSEELYRIFGRDPNLPAPTYKEHPSLYTAESWMLLKSAVERALASGEPYELELELIREDGEHRWIIASGKPIRDETGRVVRLHGTAQDITERKRLETQFHQAQKMESVGRLAGGVAHDFNNHLGIIIGYSELLLERLGADDPLRKNAGMIKEAALRSASLTRQLLAFSRRQVIEPRVLDLNASVSELEKMLRPLIGEDIELITSLDPALGKVRADPAQIDQVIMNLAVNSRDAMPQGGRLTIETANVELDEAYVKTHFTVQAGSYVMLAVSDTGMGIGMETLSHIFEPFFTTKEKDKGTGLGLAMVYGIVKQSGGCIWVYSEPGQGATFKIYLPRLKEGILVAEVERVSPSSLKGGETVIVVEDEAMLRELACEFLQGDGYKVLEAGNGAEAMEISKRHEGPIHLLMTDVVMPGMSGRELALWLHDSRPDTKVLYVSGYTDDVILRNGLLEAGTAFLQKPFTRDAFTRKVRAVLGESRLPLAAEPITDLTVPAVPQASVPGPVDVSVLAGLVGNNPEVVRNFQQAFRLSAAGIAAELRAACAAGQATAAGAAAHKLKSSARAVGALALGELCAEMERAGNAGQMEAVASLLPKFEAEMAAVDDYLGSL